MQAPGLVSRDCGQQEARLHRDVIERGAPTVTTTGCYRRSLVQAMPIGTYSSRWTIPGENAGTQTETYRAPPSAGVE